MRRDHRTSAPWSWFVIPVSTADLSSNGMATLAAVHTRPRTIPIASARHCVRSWAIRSFWPLVKTAQLLSIARRLGHVDVDRQVGRAGEGVLGDARRNADGARPRRHDLVRSDDRAGGDERAIADGCA